MSHKIKPWLLCFFSKHRCHCDKSKFFRNMFLQEAESSSTRMKKLSCAAEQARSQRWKLLQKPARPPQVGATHPSAKSRFASRFPRTRFVAEPRPRLSARRDTLSLDAELAEKLTGAGFQSHNFVWTPNDLLQQGSPSRRGRLTLFFLGIRTM
jgi:hypothetical protein